MELSLTNCNLALAFLGLISLLKLSKSLLKWFYLYFIRPEKDLKAHYGPWALITGPTDGIGKAIAFQLAHRGLNLILVGRNPSKLASVASDILAATNSQVHVKTLVLDFAQDVSTKKGTIEDAIAGLDVGLLVNNAGTSYWAAAYFDEVKVEEWMEVVRVNVEATTCVTRLVVKGMVERGKGAVVNIGSGSSCVVPSYPLASVYSASKAYIDQLSRCLYVEYKSKGIDVQCQVPLYVATKMISTKRTSFFVPSADTYARSSLRWIGYEPRCTPYWPHSLLWCLISILPDSAADSMFLSYFLKIRKKCQLKAAKKKEQ